MSDSGKSTATRCVFFELGGIPQRELDKLEQDEERFEKFSFVHIFFMARQKEEWERGVNTTCNTNEFFADKWHYTIIDNPGRRDFTKNITKGSTHSWFTPDSLFLYKQFHLFCL